MVPVASLESPADPGSAVHQLQSSLSPKRIFASSPEYKQLSHSEQIKAACAAWVGLGGIPEEEDSWSPRIRWSADNSNGNGTVLTAPPELFVVGAERGLLCPEVSVFTLVSFSVAGNTSPTRQLWLRGVRLSRPGLM